VSSDLIGTAVFVTILVVAAIWGRVRVVRRRRESQEMFVSTWPDIELRQIYGGWDADPYDAGTGRDQSIPLVVPVRKRGHR
jgi:hypothetical protein